MALTALVTVMSMGSVACNLEIDQTLGLDEGSAMEVEVPAGSGSVGVATVEGGTIMNIDIAIGLFDILFGSIEGDVSVGELLFASSGFNLLGIDTEELCVIPDPVDPGGGTFAADIYGGSATFDVAINTRALVGSPILGAAIPDGFAFPFALQSTMPLSLGDMIGMLTGSGGLSVSQSLDETFDVTVGAITLPIHLGGTLNLSSVDAFPTSPLMDACLAIVAP
ncbi:MAG: hypothetical protein OEV20_00670 [Actinomycetota bacterium]|nr:hypothetical protein [Actinomycetota bacterium]